jgi:hypothetical protein
MGAFVSQTDFADTGASSSIGLSSFVCNTGERLHAWVTYGNGSALSESMSDGTNTWTKVGSSASDSGNGQSECEFEALNVVGGTYNPSCSLGSSVPYRAICIARYTGLDAAAAGQGVTALVNSPGSGANAVGPGSITPSAQPGLGRGVTMDSSGTGEPSLTPTAGWTSRGAMSNIESAFGVKTGTEDKAITSLSAFAATFTAGSGSGNFLSAGYYARDSSGVAPTFPPVPSPVNPYLSLIAH